MQCLDKDDAAQPLHDRDGHAKPVVQDQVHRPRAAKQQLHCRRADKRRHHQRQHTQCLDQHRAPELKAHGQVGQRHGDDGGEQHRHPRDKETVGKRLPHQ